MSEPLISNQHLDLSEIRARLAYAASAQDHRPFARPSFCADIQDLLAEIERLRAALDEAHRRVASMMNHMEDHWRGIDDGPIELARAYLKLAMVRERQPVETKDG